MKRHIKKFSWRFLVCWMVAISVIISPVGFVLAQEIQPIEQPPQEEQIQEQHSEEENISETDNLETPQETSSADEAATQTDEVTPPNLKPAPNNKQSLPDVDISSGALTYSYNLRLPPGRRSIQPNLSLAYNNQNTDEGSLFGFGWGLSIPVIERKNLNGITNMYAAHDFSSSLDGDLKIVSGSGNYVSFGSKIDSGSFIKYVLHDQAQGGWWTAQTKQGITYTFGAVSSSRMDNPTDSTKVFRWYITKIEDTIGNSVSFEYSKFNAQVYPVSIHYTNFEEEEGLFSVNFTLEDRDDTAITAKPGFVVQTTKRIQKMETYADSNLIGKYDFGYVQALINNRTQLSQIQFTGYDENAQSTVEPSTQFDYDSIGATNLLTEITQSTGGVVSVTYKPSAQYLDSNGAILNPHLSFTIQTVEEIEYNDGNGIIWDNTFEYSGGWYYYNGALDRRFVGFEKVIKTESNGTKTISYYHQGNGNNSASGEEGDNSGKIGKLYKAEILDSNQNVYNRTLNSWSTADLGNDRTFVKLVQSIELVFDGNQSHKDKASSFSYDNTTGNLTQKIDWGEVSSSGWTFTDSGLDKFVTDITYATNNDISAAATETVSDQTTAKVSETKHYYDGLPLGQISEGNETKTEQWVSGTNYIDIEKTYNNFGLVTLEKDPLDHETAYTYDAYNLYPATITNALNQATSFEYDYSLGKPKRIIDSNGYSFYTDYDGLDRTITERIPDVNNENASVTKTSYEYVDTPNAVRVKQSNHLDSNNVVDNYTYFDGLGRKIQERSEAEASGQFNVKDFVYTSGDLLLKESLPYASAGSSRTTATTNNNLYTNYSYDALKRVTTAQTVVGSTYTNYDDWKTTVTDAKGKVKDLYKDAYDNLVQVNEHNGANTYSTYYQWNGLKKLTKITDALNNIRNFSYDGLGRVLEAEDLHAVNDSTFGVWAYVYDEAGNLISKIEPNSKEVEYTYDDLNRVVSEDLVGNDDVEATFEYDNCTNGVGRLCLAANLTVRIFPTYNPLGQLIQEEKRIGRAYYVTNYSYDLQGNQLLIENPDASQIRYSYSNSGTVNKIERKEDTDINFSDVISNITYNPVNLPTEISYANGAISSNTYDANELYRLRQKVTTANDQNVQDLTYTYDQVGNITEIVDASTTATAKTTNYTYDDLHRLLSSTITDAADDSPGNSVQTFVYDAIGNITYKSDVGSYSYNGNQGDSYANPHAVTTAGDYQYDYDEQGNLIQIYSNQNDQTKSYIWDYNNRLTSAYINGTPYSYAYDTTGQRIKETTTAGTTYYLTKNYSVNPENAEKHIFLGDTAIATVSDTGDKAVVYNIHADHLTSSNVITDSNQSIDELLDYYSFGSIRIDAQNGTHNEKRKHTGHEYDEDTGLTYANARYYNTALGRWISQDPVFIAVADPQKVKEKTQLEYPQYLAMPQSMNAYSYVGNNPLKYKDVKGESEWWAWAFNPVGTLKQVAFWRSGASYIRNIGLHGTKMPIAAQLLDRSLSLSPKNIVATENNEYSNLASSVKNSSDYSKYVDNVIANTEAAGLKTINYFRRDTESVVFGSGDDLNYAIGGTKSISIQGTRDSGGQWNLDVSIHDVYDFQPKNYSSVFGDTINNTAIISQSSGVISNYGIDIKFNDKRKR